MTLPRFVLVLAAALASLALPVSANAAPPKAAELRISSFKLQGSNDYEVEVVAAKDGGLLPTALVLAKQGPLEARYEVRGEAGAGIHATFGSLGQLDVSFERRSREIDRPEPGCRWIFEKGVFRGSFRFAGEGGYFTSEATDPPGEVLRLPNGFCGFESFRPARLEIPGFNRTVVAARAPTGTGTLSFEASRLNLVKRRIVEFQATLRERVGEMKIERTAQVKGSKRTFLLPQKTRAEVNPPSPFRGSAEFRDPAGGPATWTGSLSVPLPGVPDVALAGEDFTAKLCPRLPVLSNCLRGGGRPFYGSGSHSQPLALARLSSLR